MQLIVSVATLFLTSTGLIIRTHKPTQVTGTWRMANFVRGFRRMGREGGSHIWSVLHRAAMYRFGEDPPMHPRMHPLQLKREKREFVFRLIFFGGFLACFLIFILNIVLLDSATALYQKALLVITAAGLMLGLGLEGWFEWRRLQQIVPDDSAQPPAPHAVAIKNSVSGVIALAVFVLSVAAVVFILLGIIGLLVFGIRQIF
jgi:hypothetical protein